MTQGSPPPGPYDVVNHFVLQEKVGHLDPLHTVLSKHNGLREATRAILASVDINGAPLTQWQIGRVSARLTGLFRGCRLVRLTQTHIDAIVSGAQPTLAPSQGANERRNQLIAHLRLVFEGREPIQDVLWELYSGTELRVLSAASLEAGFDTGRIDNEVLLNAQQVTQWWERLPNDHQRFVKQTPSYARPLLASVKETLSAVVAIFERWTSSPRPNRSKTRITEETDSLARRAITEAALNALSKEASHFYENFVK